MRSASVVKCYRANAVAPEVTRHHQFMIALRSRANPAAFKPSCTTGHRDIRVRLPPIERDLTGFGKKAPEPVSR